MSNFNQNLIKNPIFKIVGILAILYFALIADKKDDPDSLAARFSKENVKKNLSEASKKTNYIVENLRKAEEFNKNKAKNDKK